MADIFLSYAREDRERAERLAKALEEQGWSVFWDLTIPAGLTWDTYIGGELEKARCVVVAWSKAAVDSEWVREEARYGKNREILIPLLFEDVEPPFGFAGMHAVDLAGWDGDPGAALAFKRLTEGMQRLLGKHQPGVPLERQKPGEPLYKKLFQRNSKTVAGAILVIFVLFLWFQPWESGRALTGQEVEELQLEFETVVDAELRKYQEIREVGDSADTVFVVKLENYEGLRDRLTSIIKSKVAKRDRVWKPPPGSFFDRGELDDFRPTSYLEEFQRLGVQTTSARLAQIQNFEKSVRSAADALHALADRRMTTRDDPENPQALQLILRNASTAPPMSTLLDQIQQGTGVDPVTFLGLPESWQAQQLEGLPQDHPPIAQTLRDVWDAAEARPPIKERITRIRGLSRALWSLVELAELASVDLGDAGTEEVEMMLEFPAAGVQMFGIPVPSRREELVSQTTVHLDVAVINLYLLERTLEERSKRISEWVGKLLAEAQPTAA